MKNFFILVLCFVVGPKFAVLAGENSMVMDEMKMMIKETAKDEIINEIYSNMNAYNENIGNMDYFINRVPKKEDQDFMRIYLDKAKVKRLMPVKVVKNEFVVEYGKYKISFSMEDYLESRIKVNGRSIHLGKNKNIKQLVSKLEIKLVGKMLTDETTVFHRMGPVLERVRSLVISEAIADDMFEITGAGVSSDDDGKYLVGAILALGSGFEYVNPLSYADPLNRNVGRVMNDIINRGQSCETDLATMRAAATNGTQVSPHLRTYPLLNKMRQLVNITNPTSADYQAQIQMGRDFEKYLYTNDSRDVADCEDGVLGRNMGFAYDDESEFCRPYHALLTCVVEFNMAYKTYQSRGGTGPVLAGEPSQSFGSGNSRTGRQ